MVERIPEKGLKAFILGASGAIGRVKRLAWPFFNELVNELCASPEWSEVVVIVRRKLENWDKLSAKLKIIEVKELDVLEKTDDWNMFKGFNSVFCCLGGRTKNGKELLRKTDYFYPLYGGQIAQKFDIPHYSIVTSTGSDKKSMFLYLKTKGEVEEALKNLKLDMLTIFKPGLLVDRNNDSRIGEKIMKWVPFLSKILAKDVAIALMKDAQQYHFKQEKPTKGTWVAYENDKIKQISKL